MLFQDSIGVDIRDDGVSIAYVKGSFSGFKLHRYAAFEQDADQPVNEKMTAVDALVSDFKKIHHLGEVNVHLGISDHLAVCREVLLPIAVKESLRSTLTYEMEKYIPVSPDEILFDYQVLREDKANNRLHVLLAVVKKEAFAPYLELAQKLSGGVSGIQLSGIALGNAWAYVQKKEKKSKGLNLEMIESAAQKDFDAAADRFAAHSVDAKEQAAAFGLALSGLWPAPFSINLLPDAFRRRPSRVGLYLLAVMLVCFVLSGLAWGGSYWLRQRMILEEMNKEITRLTQEIKQIDRIKSENEVIENKVKEINEIRQDGVTILNILREMTEVIPENAWIRDLILTEGNKIDLYGYAESASDLILLLENSPLFKDVVFMSAITKDKDGKEKFRIGLKASADE